NSHRSFFDDPVHHPDVFGKAATRRLKPGGAADFLVAGTLREGPVTAVVTLTARDVMKDHHPVACAELTDLFPHLRDDPSRFVAKNTRRRVRSGGNFLQVGSANAAGVDSHQNL